MAMIYTYSLKSRNFTLSWNHNTSSCTRYIPFNREGKRVLERWVNSASFLTVYNKTQGRNFNADSQQSLETNWSSIQTKRKDALRKMALQSSKVFLQAKQDILHFPSFSKRSFTGVKSAHFQATLITVKECRLFPAHVDISSFPSSF